MKKLLITGASGFLGSRIREYYQTQYEILAPSHEEMDITKESAVLETFQKARPDRVIHCAAISDTGRCEREPELAYEINVNGSRNIAKAAKAVDAKCLICSSDQVYFGSDVREPHKESEHLVPGNEYGWEKLEAEKLCLLENPDGVLLRLSWMYDVKSRNELEHGDFIRTLFASLKERKPASYPIYDVRGITEVWEVIRNMERAFELPGGVYNFGSPNDLTTYETVRRLFETCGLNTKLLSENRTAFSDKPRNLAMCQEKINGHGIRFSSTLEALVRNLKLNRWCLF